MRSFLKFRFIGARVRTAGCRLEIHRGVVYIRSETRQKSTIDGAAQSGIFFITPLRFRRHSSNRTMKGRAAPPARQIETSDRREQATASPPTGSHHRQVRLYRRAWDKEAPSARLVGQHAWRRRSARRRNPHRANGRARGRTLLMLPFPLGEERGEGAWTKSQHPLLVRAPSHASIKGR